MTKIAVLSAGSVTRSRLLIASYVAACLTALIYSAAQKGIWIDKAYTQFASRHDLSVFALWRAIGAVTDSPDIVGQTL